MPMYLLSAVIIILIVYIVFLDLKRRLLWENYQVERIRREWELAYFYYQMHPKDIDILTKEYFFEDYPLLKKVFTNSDLEEIKKYIKKGNSDVLPYMENVDEFIDKVLYNGKPPIFRKFWRR